MVLGVAFRSDAENAFPDDTPVGYFHVEPNTPAYIILTRRQSYLFPLSASAQILTLIPYAHKDRIRAELNYAGPGARIRVYPIELRHPGKVTQVSMEWRRLFNFLLCIVCSLCSHCARVGVGVRAHRAV